MGKWKYRSYSIGQRSSKRKKKCSYFQWAQIIVGLFVPIAITIYTIVQTNNENLIAEENRRQDVDLANKTRLNDLSIADNSEKETIMNNYLQFLTKLLEKDSLNLNLNMSLHTQGSLRFILQFNTLNVFSQLDSKRKSYLIRCLYGNGLITHEKNDSPLINLNSANLIQLDLSHHHLIHSYKSILVCAVFVETDLSESSFENIQISGSYFHYSIMTKVNLKSTIAHETFCDDGHMTRTIFSNSFLFKSSFIKSVYADVIFTGALMNNSLLRQFECARCDFSRALMIQCDFSYAKFVSESSFSIINNQSKSLFIESDLTDSILYETIFEKTIFQKSILRQINATKSYFIQCHLSNVTMDNCILTQSQFNDSTIISSNLTNCKMNKIKMINVDFSRSILVNVDFSDSQCHSCIFHQTNLTGINFRNTSLDHSYFTDAIFNHQQLIPAKSILGIHL